MKKKILAFFLAVTMTAPALLPITADAADTVMYDNEETGYASLEDSESGQEDSGVNLDDYFLKWSDEFDGEALNRDAWNVEIHEKGWVNEELQEYVDSSENIKVEGGKLVITPTKEEITETSEPGEKYAIESVSDVELYQANWEGKENPGEAQLSVDNGTASLAVTSFGDEEWNVQLRKENINVESGDNYVIKFVITSDIKKSFKAALSEGDGEWFGGSEFSFTDSDLVDGVYKKTIVFETGVINKTVSNGKFAINIGKFSDEDIAMPESGPAHFTISGLEVKCSTEGSSTTTTEYKSGRISTQNKETFTYGYFETRAKVPEGAGYLPAFWLMANDESIYGQWPQCGEIDCMEVWGSVTDKVYGTIHFGLPESEKQGAKVVESDLSKDFHVYGCEWEPDCITWYIDGEKYFSTNQWYSASTGNGTLTYPAPFDQPFYIILNLAVGGRWVGNIDENTFDENNTYEVDYVRVYQKADYDDTGIAEPENKFTPTEIENGTNYLLNPSFDSEDTALDGTNGWNFKINAENGGAGSAQIVNTSDNNYLKIVTETPGSVDYAVQLVQAGLKFEKNSTYKISFDAYTNAESGRQMNFDVKAPDRGYIKYMDTKVCNLTTTVQHYEYEFVMNEKSDENGRIEYNMGGTDSSADIYIDNVVVTRTITGDPDAKDAKTLRGDGNYIYNGSFDEGMYYLGEWEVESNVADAADYAVTSFADGRRFNASIPYNGQLVLKQEGLGYNSGKPYEFSFECEASKPGKIIVQFDSNSAYTFNIAAGKYKYSHIFTADEIVKTNGDITITFTGENEFSFDNVKLSDAALMKNGDFASGNAGFYIYTGAGTAASISTNADGELVANVKSTGSNNWDIQIKQDNIPLVKGDKYKLQFKAKSDLDRSIRAIMQGNLTVDGFEVWPVYSNPDVNGDGFYSLTNEYKTFTADFEMLDDTDNSAFLSICLGQPSASEVISAEHNIYFDNISLTAYRRVGVMLDENTEYVYIEEGKTIGDTLDSYTSVLEEPGFAGWYTQPDGEGTQVTSSTAVKAQMNVYPYFVDSNMHYEFLDDINTYTYTSGAIKPQIVVKFGKTVLTEGKDYVVSYKNNTNVSTATEGEKAPQVVVTGKGNFAGKSGVMYFKITEKSLLDSDVVIQKIDDMDFSNRAYTTVPKVTVNGKVLATSKYKCTFYKDGDMDTPVVPKEAGSYTYVIEGKNEYKDCVSGSFNIYSQDTKLVKNLKITFKKSSVAYSGKELSNDQLVSVFGITVKNGTKTLVYGDDYTVSTESDTINVGTVLIKISGNGKNYIGETTREVKITGIALSKARISGFANSLNYNNGNAVIQQNVVLKNGESLIGIALDEYNELSPAEKKEFDYTVSYINNTECGKATVVYTGVNKYTGNITKTFTIKGTSISKATALYATTDGNFAEFKSNLSLTYNGRPVVFSDIRMKIGDDNQKVVLKSQYDQLSSAKKKEIKCIAEYANNTNAGKATITITGVNGYEGTVKKTFTIKAYNIKDNTENRFTAKLLKSSYKFEKAGVKPVPVVKFNGVILKENVDYTLKYLNNTSVNGKKTPTVQITGKGNFTGANTTCTFEIAKADIRTGIYLVAKDVKYANKDNNFKTSVVVTDKSGKKLSSSDYTVKYYTYDGETVIPNKTRVANGTEVFVTIEGKGNYVGTLTTSFRLYTTDINSLKVTVANQQYTGKAVTLSAEDFTFYMNGKKVDNVSFAIDETTYVKNVDSGTATVEIKGIGEFGGSKKVTFKIIRKSFGN